jgi:hypothetical protein
MSRPDDVPGRDSDSRIVPAPYPSRRSLARALDMAESTVDEMVKRGSFRLRSGYPPDACVGAGRTLKPP